MTQATPEQTRVLVIDDDAEVASLVRVWLERNDFAVDVANDGLAGLRQLYQSRPDLVVLDVSMPKMDGWEVCRRIRELDSVPVIMLTAKSDMTCRVKGFDLGADDYLTKPFELPELLARVRAILRRSRALQPQEDTERVISQGDLAVDLETHRVSVAGKPVDLSPTEFRLLSFLIQNRGKIVSHTQILANVWGPEYRDQIAYVKLYIRYLREKIESNPATPQYILTERGFGYQFVGQATRGQQSARAEADRTRLGGPASTLRQVSVGG
jgi:DNA-binding response OmpR family regulator